MCIFGYSAYLHSDTGTLFTQGSACDQRVKSGYHVCPAKAISNKGLYFFHYDLSCRVNGCIFNVTDQFTVI